MSFVRKEPISANEKTVFQRLMEACETGDTQIIELLVKESSELATQKGNGGETPMIAATRNGHLNVVQLLSSYQDSMDIQCENGNTCLHIASENGHTEIAQFLLSSNAQVNIKNNNGETPLLLASKNGHINVVQRLITNLADVDNEDANGDTCLHHAALRGHTEVANCLISCKAPISKKNNEGLTPLFYATISDQLTIIQNLRKAGADADVKSSEGISPVHWAAYWQYSETLQSLLGEISSSEPWKNSIQDQIDSHKNFSPPLETPIFQFPFKTLNYLLEFQEKLREPKPEIANENNPNNSVTTEQEESQESDLPAWQEAPAVETKLSKSTEKEIQGLLERRDDAKLKNILLNESVIKGVNDRGENILHVLCAKDRLELVKQVISRVPYSYVDMKNKHMNTPLHFAAKVGNVDLMMVLMKRGADATQKNCEGRTPLHVAAINGKVKASICLMKVMGPKGTQIPDKDGNTALILAQEEGHMDVVECLEADEENDKNVASPDKTAAAPKVTIGFQDKITKLKELVKLGYEPMHLVILNNDEESSMVLLKYRITDLTIKSLNGHTPLHLAVINKRTEIIRATLRVQKNSYLNEQDENGNTALHLAVIQNSLEITHILLEEKANTKIKNKDGKTPFHIACEVGDGRVIQCFPKNQLPDLMRRLDFKRNSPLHAAILNGHVDAVKILLAAGANPRAINEEKRTPMHLAVATREIDIVRVLVEKAMFNNIRDGNWETPLDLAAKEGSLEIMKLLLDNAVHAKDYEQSYFQNLVLPPALFLACRSGYADIVELLLRKETAFGGYRNMDSIRAAFQICVDEKRKTCALVLLKLDWWKQSGIDNELMCNIIRETPDIAKSIFDECIFERPDMTFELECNYLILTSYPPEEKKKPPRHNQVDFEEKVVKAIEPIVVRDPLEEIIECEDDELLCHPLVINVVEQLWNSFAIDYFLAILLLYLAFLATFTAFIMYLPLTTGTNCVVTANFTIHSSTTTQTELVLKILQICVLTLAGIQLFKELIQLLAGIVSMFKTRSAPDIFSFRNVENLIEWTLYTMSILTVSNEDPCATETSINREVQNNISVIAIFLAWINLIFLLRKLPTLGIYIVMAIDIFKTLMTFSVVLIMFLVAFAFGFHRALSNQIAFKDMGRSLLKTFVMMTGEYEYKDTFNARFETLTQENNIVYPIATYFLFVIFILTMNILIMNLMIGLSVYDISAMKEKAKPTKYRELILFILETKTIRRRLRLPDLETDHGRIIVSPARLYQKALPFICYKGFKELERFNRSRKSETNVLKENQEKADRILRQQDEKADDTIKRLKSMKEFLDTTFGQASGGRGQAAGRTNDTTASRLDKLEAMFQANQAILQNLQTMVEGMAQK